MAWILSHKFLSKYIQIKHILDANNLSDDFFIIINNSFKPIMKMTWSITNKKGL